MINTRVRGCVCSVGMRCMGHVAVPRTNSVRAYGSGSFSLIRVPGFGRSVSRCCAVSKSASYQTFAAGDVRGSIYEPGA